MSLPAQPLGVTPHHTSYKQSQHAYVAKDWRELCPSACSARPCGAYFASGSSMQQTEEGGANCRRDQVRRFLRLTWLLVDDALIASILGSMERYLLSFPEVAAAGGVETREGARRATMTLRVSLVWDNAAGQLAYVPPLEDFVQLGEAMLEEMKEVLTELQVRAQ